MDKSYENFTAAIKTKATMINYTRALEKFREFCGVKNYDDYLSMSDTQIKDHLVKYVKSIKHLTYPSCNSYLSAIELFLDMNEIAYPKRVIRRMLPANNKKPGGGLPYTNDDIQNMLKITYNPLTRFLIHVSASTGERPGALYDPPVTLGDIVDMPDGCKGLLAYKGTKEEYWTFWTPECVSAYNDYISMRRINGEYLTNESPLLVSMGKPLAYRGARKLLENVIDKSVQRVKIGHRFDKALFYGFRKRFNTILKIDNDVNSNIAEKLMAHKRGLDGVYLQPTREECFAEFRKAIKELTISEVGRQKQKIVEQEKEIIEKSITQEQLSEQQKTIDRMEKIIEMLAEGKMIRVEDVQP